MTIPLINQDTAGNSYYGWRANNYNYAPGSLDMTATNCVNWINGFFGQTCAFTNGIRGPAAQFSLILPTGFESLTLPATSSKFRFNKLGISDTNTNPATTSMNVQYCGEHLCFDFMENLWQVNINRITFAVLNSQSLNIFSSNVDFTQPVFFSIGWLKNSLYSGVGFVRSAYYFWQFVGVRGAGRPFGENTSITRNFVTTAETTVNPLVNYPVSCQTTTPGANATEFYLRDNVAPNKAIGYMPNILKSSLNIPVGQVYKNTGIDPDNSNNPYWICVGKMGNESTLMRAWASGLLD